jgi:hypothetical protein
VLTVTLGRAQSKLCNTHVEIELKNLLAQVSRVD